MALRTAAVLVVIGAIAVIAGPVSGRYRTLTVVTGSMEPTLPVGSLLLFTPVDASAVSVGDVITFHPPNSADLVTHRVVSVDRHDGTTAISTKGDANDGADPWQVDLASDEVWKVRAHVPALGLPFVWLRSTGVLRLAATLIPLLLAAVWLVKIWTDPEDDGEAALA